MKWILASASPRRKELIAHICREFEIKVADADETVADTDCAQTVQTLALRKALAIGPQEDAVVIGADTLVAIGQEILGKPKDREDAARMLRLLSGNVHQVYTGVAIVAAGQIRDGVAADAESLQPNYLRLSQAEREKLERQRKQ